MEGKTHGKDIMLLCKGWYNKTEYKDIKDALIAYYHKNYGCENITPDYGFINQVLFEPAIREFSEDFNYMLVSYIFKPCIVGMVNDKNISYEEGLYNRLVSFFNMMMVLDKVDTSIYFTIENASEDTTEGHRVLVEAIV